VHFFLIIININETLAYTSDCAKEQLPVLIVHGDADRHLDSFRIRLFDLVQQAFLPYALFARDTSDTR